MLFRSYNVVLDAAYAANTYNVGMDTSEGYGEHIVLKDSAGTNAMPTKVNANAVFEFQVDYDDYYEASADPNTAEVVQYKVGNGNWVTLTISGGKYTIPASTINADVTIRVTSAQPIMNTITLAGGGVTGNVVKEVTREEGGSWTVGNLLAAGPVADVKVAYDDLFYYFLEIDSIISPTGAGFKVVNTYPLEAVSGEHGAGYIYAISKFDGSGSAGVVTVTIPNT